MGLVCLWLWYDWLEVFDDHITRGAIVWGTALWVSWSGICPCMASTLDNVGQTNSTGARHAAPQATRTFEPTGACIEGQNS